jgi:hypothetical protein
MKRALLIVSLVLPAAGCASAQATAPAAPAGLEVPPVPPRVLAPLPSLEPPDIEPVQPLPEKAIPEPPQRPASRPATPAPAAPKPDPAQEVLPPEAQPASPPPAAPPLRPADSGAGPQAEEEVRLIIKRAEDMLQSIDYGNLTRDRQVNYDQAKNLLKQADESLKEKNVALARSFAKRAEDYAKVVGSR